MFLVRTALLLILLSGVACSPDAPQPKSGVPLPAADSPAGQISGGDLFRQFCHSCHPDGGNVSDPARNLRGATLRARRITTPDDIVRVMRNPRSRMIRFDEATLPDPQARAIAEHVLQAFK